MKVGTLVRHITHRDAIGMIVEKKLGYKNEKSPRASGLRADVTKQNFDGLSQTR